MASKLMIISLVLVQLPHLLANFLKLIPAGVSPVVWLHIFTRGVILATAFSRENISKAVLMDTFRSAVLGFTHILNFE
jgi:hypothetical protein